MKITSLPPGFEYGEKKKKRRRKGKKQMKRGIVKKMCNSASKILWVKPPETPRKSWVRNPNPWLLVGDKRCVPYQLFFSVYKVGGVGMWNWRTRNYSSATWTTIPFSPRTLLPYVYTNKIIGSLTTSRSGLQSAILDILFVRKKSYHSKWNTNPGITLFAYIKEGEWKNCRETFHYHK